MFLVYSIEGPQGGTPPPPNFEMGVWGCGDEILCVVSVRVSWCYICTVWSHFFSARTYDKYIKPVHSYASVSGRDKSSVETTVCVCVCVCVCAYMYVHVCVRLCVCKYV